MIDNLNDTQIDFKSKIKKCLREMNTAKDLLKTGLAFLKAFYL
jgi:hypothetical protein